jgi:hypothetical protein
MIVKREGRRASSGESRGRRDGGDEKVERIGAKGAKAQRVEHGVWRY